MAGEGPASLSGVSCMGTTVWTHPASSCSHLAVPQVQILQWQHGQGSMKVGKVYLGGTGGATKGKHKRSHTTACEGNVAGDDTEAPTKK